MQPREYRPSPRGKQRSDFRSVRYLRTRLSRQGVRSRFPCGSFAVRRGPCASKRKWRCKRSTDVSCGRLKRIDLRYYLRKNPLEFYFDNEGTQSVSTIQFTSGAFNGLYFAEDFLIFYLMENLLFSACRAEPGA